MATLPTTNNDVPIHSAELLVGWTVDPVDRINRCTINASGLLRDHECWIDGLIWTSRDEIGFALTDGRLFTRIRTELGPAPERKELAWHYAETHAHGSVKVGGALIKVVNDIGI